MRWNDQRGGRGQRVASGVAVLLVCLWAGRAAAAGGPLELDALLEPLTWQWFTDDDVEQPTPRREPGAPLTGVRPGDVLRLRVQAVCEPALRPDACAALRPGVEVRAGAYDVASDVRSQRVWAEGRGNHGERLGVLLLPGSTVAGLFLEQGAPPDWPTPVGARVEHDLALWAFQRGWQPLTRYVLALALLDPDGLARPVAASAPLPSFCTGGGGTVALAAAVPVDTALVLPTAGSVDLWDWNGDGRIDLLAGPMGGWLIWWPNESQPEDELPTWGAPRAVPVARGEGGSYVHLVVNDWDQDGVPDVLASSADGALDLLAGDGTGGLLPPQPLLVVDPDGGTTEPLRVLAPDGSTRLPDVVDLDGDGLLDVIADGGPTDLSFWPRSGPAGSLVVAARRPYPLPLPPQPAEPDDDDRWVVARSTWRGSDWDGDGDMDLFAALPHHLLWPVLNVAPPGTPPVFEATDGLRGHNNNAEPSVFGATARIAPLLANGRRFFALSSVAGPLVLWMEGAEPMEWHGNSWGSKAPPPLVSDASPLPWPAALRWPGGGTAVETGLVLVLADGTAALAPLEPNGTSLHPPGLGPTIPLGLQGIAALTLGDTNGDGHPEGLAADPEGRVLVAPGVPAGATLAFGPLAPLLAANEPLVLPPPVSLRYADWDGDGLADLLVGDGSGLVWVSLRTGAGWSAPIELAHLSGPVSLALGDWDTDSALELLVADGQGEVSLLRASEGLIGEHGQPPPEPARTTGGALQLEPGERLVAAEWVASGCAPDVVTIRPEGSLQLRTGSFATPPRAALLRPIHGAPLLQEYDPDAGLEWTADQDVYARVDPPVARFDLQIATGTDFDELVVDQPVDQLVGDWRRLRLEPPLPPGRYHWRARLVNTLGDLGPWPQPETFVVPAPRQLTTSSIPTSGKIGSSVRCGAEGASGCDLGGLSTRDAVPGEPLPTDGLCCFAEERNRAPDLRLYLQFAPVPGEYELVLLAGTLGDDEPVEVHVAETLVGTIVGPIQEYRWGLGGHSSSVRLTLSSRRDATATTLVLDYAALVLVARWAKAHVVVPRYATEGDWVVLDGSGSALGERGPTSVTWEIVGLEGPVEFEDSDQLVARFRVPRLPSNTRAQWEVRLTLRDSAHTSTAAAPVFVDHEPPTIVLPAVLQVEPGATVRIDGSASRDPDGDRLRWVWRQLDGPPLQIDPDDEPVIDVSVPAGTARGQEARLQAQVTGDSRASAVVRVEIPARPPVANAGEDRSVPEGSRVTLDGSGSFGLDGAEELTFRWESHPKLDGPNEIEAPEQARTGFRAPRVLRDTVFVLRLIVGDGRRESEDTLRLTVRNTLDEPPWADAGSDLKVVAGETVELAGQGGDPNGDEVTLAWRQTKGPAVELDRVAPGRARFVAPMAALRTDLEFVLGVSSRRLRAEDSLRVTAWPTPDDGRGGCRPGDWRRCRRLDRVAGIEQCDPQRRRWLGCAPLPPAPTLPERCSPDQQQTCSCKVGAGLRLCGSGKRWSTCLCPPPRRPLAPWPGLSPGYWQEDVPRRQR